MTSDPAFYDITVDGLAMRCYPGDNYTEHDLVHNAGRWSYPDLTAFMPLLAKGDVVVDLGANCGLFTLMSARAVGSAGRVLSVEPNRLMVDRLLFNVNANNFTNVSVVVCAVSDESSTGILNAPRVNYGAASLNPLTGAETEPTKVAIRPLMQIIRDTKITRIDVMKIDIEGYEDRAIIPLLSQDDRNLWPRAILMETRHASSWRQDCTGFLKQFGYRETWRGEFDSRFEAPTDFREAA